MARLTSKQVENFSKGGSFFKLEDGETARVRFLYDTLEDMEFVSVHELSGNGSYATVDCNRQEGDSIDVCKWCSSGSAAVGRVVIPVFNEDLQEVQYWKRSLYWVTTTLNIILQTIPQSEPISGQIFRITRTGKQLKDTTYTIAVDLSQPNDHKTKTNFGDVKDAFESNLIKPYDANFVLNTGSNEAGQDNYNAQATRRTTEIFK